MQINIPAKEKTQNSKSSRSLNSNRVTGQQNQTQRTERTENNPIAELQSIKSSDRKEQKNISNAQSEKYLQNHNIGNREKSFTQRQQNNMTLNYLYQMENQASTQNISKSPLNDLRAQRRESEENLKLKIGNISKEFEQIRQDVYQNKNTTQVVSNRSQKDKNKEFINQNHKENNNSQQEEKKSRTFNNPSFINQLNLQSPSSSLAINDQRHSFIQGHDSNQNRQSDKIHSGRKQFHVNSTQKKQHPHLDKNSEEFLKPKPKLQLEDQLSSNKNSNQKSNSNSNQSPYLCQENDQSALVNYAHQTYLINENETLSLQSQNQRVDNQEEFLMSGAQANSEQMMTSQLFGESTMRVHSNGDQRPDSNNNLNDNLANYLQSSSRLTISNMHDTNRTDERSNNFSNNYPLQMPDNHRNYPLISDKTACFMESNYTFRPNSNLLYDKFQTPSYPTTNSLTQREFSTKQNVSTLQNSNHHQTKINIQENDYNYNHRPSLQHNFNNNSKQSSQQFEQALDETRPRQSKQGSLGNGVNHIIGNHSEFEMSRGMMSNDLQKSNNFNHKVFVKNDQSLTTEDLLFNSGIVQQNNGMNNNPLELNSSYLKSRIVSDNNRTLEANGRQSIGYFQNSITSNRQQTLNLNKLNSIQTPSGKGSKISEQVRKSSPGKFSIHAAGNPSDTANNFFGNNINHFANQDDRLMTVANIGYKLNNSIEGSYGMMRDESQSPKDLIQKASQTDYGFYNYNASPNNFGSDQRSNDEFDIVDQHQDEPQSNLLRSSKRDPKMKKSKKSRRRRSDRKKEERKLKKESKRLQLEESKKSSKGYIGSSRLLDMNKMYADDKNQEDSLGPEFSLQQVQALLNKLKNQTGSLTPNSNITGYQVNSNGLPPFDSKSLKLQDLEKTVSKRAHHQPIKSSVTDDFEKILQENIRLMKQVQLLEEENDIQKCEVQNLNKKVKSKTGLAQYYQQQTNDQNQHIRRIETQKENLILDLQSSKQEIDSLKIQKQELAHKLKIINEEKIGLLKINETYLFQLKSQDHMQRELQKQCEVQKDQIKSIDEQRERLVKALKKQRENEDKHLQDHFTHLQQRIRDLENQILKSKINSKIEAQDFSLKPSLNIDENGIQQSSYYNGRRSRSPNEIQQKQAIYNEQQKLIQNLVMKLNIVNPNQILNVVSELKAFQLKHSKDKKLIENLQKLARDCTSGENGCVIPLQDNKNQSPQDENDQHRFNRPSLLAQYAGSNTTIENSTITCTMNFNNQNGSGKKQSPFGFTKQLQNGIRDAELPSIKDTWRWIRSLVSSYVRQISLNNQFKNTQGSNRSPESYKINGIAPINISNIQDYRSPPREQDRYVNNVKRSKQNNEKQVLRNIFKMLKCDNQDDCEFKIAELLKNKEDSERVLNMLKYNFNLKHNCPLNELENILIQKLKGMYVKPFFAADMRR
eukprot:403352035